MRTGSGRIIVAGAAVLAAAATHAYPEGAPWGAAHPDAEETCASCHYDYEPRRDSAALAIEGLPATAVAGRRYALTLHLRDETAVTAGFQLIAASDGDAGRLSSDDESIETAGAAARSVRPTNCDDGVAWAVEWQAPATRGVEVVFLLAASSANDDQSPFGDRIHYRRYTVDVTARD